jgi:hypothetical protein
MKNTAREVIGPKPTSRSGLSHRQDTESEAEKRLIGNAAVNAQREGATPGAAVEAFGATFAHKSAMGWGPSTETKCRCSIQSQPKNQH